MEGPVFSVGRMPNAKEGIVKALSEGVIKECRAKLIETRHDILNRVRTSKSEYESMDKSGGDEADQTMSLLAEHDFLASQQRMMELLLEVDFALSRIENGTYGICEETEEMIEVERLRAIPWTRLSIEGAELREALRRRFARGQ